MPELDVKRARNPKEKLTFLKAIVKSGDKKAIDRVEEIDIEDYPVQSEDINVIADAGYYCSRLNKLRLKKCKINADTSYSLWRRLAASKAKLTLLDYSDNELTGETLLFARNLLTFGGELILQRCSLSPDDLKTLAAAINKKKLSVLDLSGNALTYEVLSSLASAVKSGGEVITKNCGINTPGLQKLRQNMEFSILEPIQRPASYPSENYPTKIRSPEILASSTPPKFAQSQLKKPQAPPTVETQSRKPRTRTLGQDPTRSVYDAKEPMKHVVFNVSTRNETVVSAPYAKVRFPKRAKDQSIEIEMWADYSSYEEGNEDIDEFPVSPKLVFKSKQNMIFTKDVVIELDVNYSAGLHDSPLDFKIKRTSKGHTTTVKEVKHLSGRRVSFSLREFCTIRVTGSRQQLNRADRHLCSAIIMSRPETEHPKQHTMRWHLCDYRQDFIDIIKTEREQPSNKVLVPVENFYARNADAGTQIALSMSHESLVFWPPSSHRVRIEDVPIQRNYLFTVEQLLNESEDSKRRFKVNYKIQQENEVHETCLEGYYPLDWNTQPQHKLNMTVIAQGHSSTGISIITTEESPRSLHT